MIVGLTGGIASGKSTVSNYFKALGSILIDADLISREIVEVGKPAYKEIVSYFTEDILNEDKTINRKALSKIVFNDKRKLIALNEITHSKIIEEIKRRIEYYICNKPGSLIILDAALLIELNLKDLVDEVWLVYVDQNTQIKRLTERDHITSENALKIISSQLSLDEKKKHAHRLIDNNSSVEELYKILDKLYQTYGG